MGLARHKPLSSEDNYSITYYAPQPRAVLRVIDDQTGNPVEYDTWGRVQLTTLTKEFFMPKFKERDEAIRRKPIEGSLGMESVKFVPSARWKRKLLKEFIEPSEPDTTNDSTFPSSSSRQTL